MGNRASHRIIVGQNIRLHRGRAGLTLEKVAEKAEMSWSYLSEVENGKENISLDKLANIARALDVKVADLVKGA